MSPPADEERDRLFYRLFQEHARFVRQVVDNVLYNLDPTGIDDVVQNTFVKCWRSFKLENANGFRFWVAIAAKRNAIDRMRRVMTTIRNRVRSDTAVVETRGLSREDEDPCEWLFRKEQRDIIREALVATVSPRARQIFELRIFEGLSYKEITAIVGCAYGTTMSSLNRTTPKVVAYVRARFIQHPIPPPPAQAA